MKTRMSQIQMNGTSRHCKLIALESGFCEPYMTIEKKRQFKMIPFWFWFYLHFRLYASICGHLDVVIYLLNHGGYRTISDIEMERCVRGTNDPKIKEALVSFQDVPEAVWFPLPTGAKINHLNSTSRTVKFRAGTKIVKKPMARTTFAESLNNS